jgi:hypothetical protein
VCVLWVLARERSQYQELTANILFLSVSSIMTDFMSYSRTRTLPHHEEKALVEQMAAFIVFLPSFMHGSQSTSDRLALKPLRESAALWYAFHGRLEVNKPNFSTTASRIFTSQI